MYKITFMIVLTLHATTNDTTFLLSTEMFLLDIPSVWSLNLDLI